MAKLVFLHIDATGNFQDGFKGLLVISEDGATAYNISNFTMPAAGEMPDLYDTWQNKYYELGETRDISLGSNKETNISIVSDCKDAARKMESALTTWFKGDNFKNLQKQIEHKIKGSDRVRVIIDTDNIYLKKIPWQLWDLFKNAQLALSFEYSEDFELNSITPSLIAHAKLRHPVRILAIFGGNEGLKLDEDKELLNQLKSQGAIVEEIIQPSLEHLSDKLWNVKCDILFFAGHSSSNQKCISGQIAINQNQTISIQSLSNCLAKAVENGLKLAIFNSCDGLGLATQLGRAGVPQIIVMREPVPDDVARKFLKYFLENFANGEDFYLAVQNASKRLKWMEEDNPCATWLPIICQNLKATALEWPKKPSTVESPMQPPPLISEEPNNSTDKSSTETKNKIQDRGDTIKINPLAHLRNKKVAFGLVLLLIAIASTIFGIIFPPDNRNQKNIVSSKGKHFLIDSNPNEKKESAAKAFEAGLEAVNKNDANSAQQQFQKALNLFSESLNTSNNSRNDPETRIYLNNAFSFYPGNNKQLVCDRTFLTNSLQNFNNNKPPIDIAVVVSIVNFDKNKAEEILRGVAHAQNEINCQGGISGRMLQVTIFNDEDNKSLAEKIADEISRDQKFLAVIGHTSSNTTKVAADVYNNKIVTVSPTSTAIRNSSKHTSPFLFNEYVFRTPVSDVIAMERLFTYWKTQLAQKKIAIAYVDTDYSLYYKQYFLDHHLRMFPNANVFDKNNCKIHDKLIASRCINAIRDRADVLLLLPNQKNLAKTFELVNENYKNKKRLFILAPDIMYSELTLYQDKTYRASAENLVVAVHWLRNENNTTPFENNAQSLWGKGVEVNWRTTTAYDAAKVIITGLGYVDLDQPIPNIRQQLQRVLSDTSFTSPGALEEVKFEDGDRKIDKNDNKPTFGVLGQVKCNPTENKCEFIKIE